MGIKMKKGRSYIILMYTEIISELSKEELEKEIENGKLKIEKPIIKVLEKP
ncbi:MAG: hypothetical protein QW128_02185 [Thermoprotei archaeon]